jgi:hypothetical protein
LYSRSYVRRAVARHESEQEPPEPVNDPPQTPQNRGSGRRDGRHESEQYVARGPAPDRENPLPQVPHVDIETLLRRSSTPQDRPQVR